MTEYRTMTLFALVMASIFTIVGFFGNLLTIAALFRIPKLRSQATTKFIMSLALSNFLFCAINLPLNMIYSIQKVEDNYDITVCRITSFFYYSNSAISLFNLVLITFNRYILLCQNSCYYIIFTGKPQFIDSCNFFHKSTVTISTQIIKGFTKILF